MEDALKELIAALKEGTVVDDAWLSKLLRRHNRATHDPLRRVAKRRLLPYYLSIRANDRERWQSWEVDEACEAALPRYCV